MKMKTACSIPDNVRKLSAVYKGGEDTTNKYVVARIDEGRATCTALESNGEGSGENCDPKNIEVIAKV